MAWGLSTRTWRAARLPQRSEPSPLCCLARAPGTASRTANTLTLSLLRCLQVKAQLPPPGKGTQARAGGGMHAQCTRRVADSAAAGAATRVQHRSWCAVRRR